jgi:hypothetical protein
MNIRRLSLTIGALIGIAAGAVLPAVAEAGS